MVIKEIYIENFGKLHDFHYSFEEGLNEIYQQNGYGKTTIGAFIKCMFFGFEGKSKRKAEELNEMNKYKPWQGGLFGGSIIFDVNGKSYELTRSFNDKKPDHLYNYSTKLESKDYSLENIGKEIFGISGESFVSTLFLSQVNYSKTSYHDVDAKIGSLTDLDGDMGSYQKAIDKLSNQKKELNNSKSGPIALTNKKIQKLEGNIYLKGSVLDSITKKTRLNEDAKSELQQVNAQYSKLKEERKVAEVNQQKALIKQQYDFLQGNVNKANKELQEEFEYFNHRLPEMEDLQKYESLSREEMPLTNTLENNRLSSIEQVEYQQYLDYFNDINVESFDYNEVVQKLEKLDNVEDQLLKEGLSEEENNEWNQLNQQFQKHPFDINKNTNLMQVCIQQVQLNEKNSKHNNSNLMLMIGFIVFVIGIVSTAIINKYIGSVVIILGAILMVLGYRLSSTNDSKQEELNKLLAIEKAKDQIIEYLRLYSITFDSNKPFDSYFAYNQLKTLEDQHKRYLSLNSRVNSEDTTSLQNKYVQLVDELKEIYLTYTKEEIDESLFTKRFAKLQQDIQKYLESKNKMATFNNAQSKMKKISNQLDSYISSFNINVEKDYLDTIQKMIVHKGKLDENTKVYKQAKNELDSYLAKHPEAVELEEIVVDLEGLNQKMTDLENNKTELEKEIDSYEKELDTLQNQYREIQEDEDELIKQKGKLDQFNYQKQILEKTIDYLEQAKNNFNEKYSQTYVNSMKKYIELLTGEKADYIGLDANKNIQISSHGQYYSSNLLSQGYADLVALCLRFALIEAMYPEGKTLLILDDPLINLDEKKIEKGLELIHQFSKQYQVIYMTCHQDRL